MSQILSENDIYTKKDMAWGTWTFSLSDAQIQKKIASLSKLAVDKSEETEHWKRLFPTFQKESNGQLPDLDNSGRSPEKEVCSPMECSPILTSDIQQRNDKIDTDDIETVMVLSSSFLDLCNHGASSLRLGINVAREQMCYINKDFDKLHKDSLIKLMDNVWSKLNSDATRLCFCIPFTSSPLLCEYLCKHILLKWLSKSMPNKLEDLSKIFSHQGETICKYLIASLLQIEDSPLVQDVMNLEDIMSSMSETNWTILLSSLIKDLKCLNNWNLPVLATIVEHSSPSPDDMNCLTHLMSSTGTDFSQNRDFGTLLVNAVNCLKSYSVCVTQLKLIANSYNLPLKYKALKVLTNIKE